MVQIKLKVDGMMCGMCESHINDAIRAAFSVKKVASSHTKGETVIVAENAIPEEALKQAIEKTGYQMTAYACEPYEKKGLFASLFGK